MKSTLAWHAALGAVLALALGTTGALAMDAEVTSDTAAQFYDVVSPTGQTTLERRRLTSTLGFGIYDLMPTNPGDPYAPELSFRLRLRYDADYGATPGTSDPTNFNSFVPGFQPQAVDLMYGYLEGRRFLRGTLGFKLGRQYVTDVLGWWSFDGGEVSVTTPVYVKAEAYGGLEQRGGLPLSTPRFEADGVWRGDRNGFDPLLYPSFQPAEVAPAFGVALESVGFTWLHSRLTYRRVYNTGIANESDFTSGLIAPVTYDGWRISSERLGYALDASAPGLGGAKGGLIYDFYRARITSAYGSLDAYLGQKVTLSADYDYYVPSFDADSIWNFFAGYPRNDVGLRANLDLDRRLSVAANAHVRIFSVQTGPFTTGLPASEGINTSLVPGVVAADYFPAHALSFDEGGEVMARWRTSTTRIAFIARGDFGSQGDRVGGDVTGEQLLETRYVVGGRVGVWQWKDDLEQDREATGFQYVLNAGYLFAPRCKGAIEWEHDINGLVGQRFRLLLTLTLGAGSSASIGSLPGTVK
ncbi:MAG TPA: hypothetical protein VEK07_20980 [Polyangiaceae bacterium]|nr:hypothetical protein [Polyangiaceae bacterium]